MWIKFVVVAVIVGIAIATALLCGARRWRHFGESLNSRLTATRVLSKVKFIDFDEIQSLPTPVQRYLRLVMTAGNPIIETAMIEHVGTFNMNETGETWRPFSSTQVALMQRPGFDWHGRIQMFPGISAVVHDAYIGGEGILRASLFGLFELANVGGTPEIAQGELMRFAAESVWYPTRLLPSQGTLWQSIDNDHARMTMTDARSTVTLTVTFDEVGLVSAVRSDGRMQLASGQSSMVPWRGRFWRYETRDGLRVPIEGEVAWELPTGFLPYWRGRIAKIRYEY